MLDVCMCLLVYKQVSIVSVSTNAPPTLMTLESSGHPLIQPRKVAAGSLPSADREHPGHSEREEPDAG